MIFTRYFCSLLIFLLPTVTYSQEVLTIEEAIRIALQNNYSISIARNSKEITDNNVAAGNAGFLPELDVDASYTERITDTRQQFLDGRNIDVKGAKSDNLSTSIELNWTIFDGLEMFAALDQLKELRKQGELNYKIQVEETISEIITNYYSLSSENKVLEVIKRTEILSEERVSIAQSMKEVGSGSKFELLQAQADLNEDKSSLLHQELRIAELKINLNRLLGRNINTEFETSSEINVDETLAYEDLENSIQNNNSELNNAISRMNLSSIELNLARSELFPEISLNAGYDFSRATTEAGFVELNRNMGLYYGINASLNLFNGLNTRLRIENAEIGIKNSQLEFENIKSNIESQLLATFKRYRNSLQLVNLETENLEVAEENVEIAVERLRLGNITPLEFRESQTNLLDAQSRLVSAQFEAKSAEIELLKLSGKLITTDL
jgi:outer membrane protein TolC